MTSSIGSGLSSGTSETSFASARERRPRGDPEPRAAGRASSAARGRDALERRIEIPARPCAPKLGIGARLRHSPRGEHGPRECPAAAIEPEQRLLYFIFGVLPVCGEQPLPGADDAAAIAIEREERHFFRRVEPAQAD